MYLGRSTQTEKKKYKRFLPLKLLKALPLKTVQQDDDGISNSKILYIS